uniref:Uncharacterized protein n=1 Tax=Rhizophagus irregularis (strain DAOM 181602 / DAOM 197198 / MUCL 43194) TaxID=747089 RepID=U9UUS5_RHIID
MPDLGVFNIASTDACLSERYPKLLLVTISIMDVGLPKGVLSVLCKSTKRALLKVENSSL